MGELNQDTGVPRFDGCKGSWIPSGAGRQAGHRRCSVLTVLRVSAVLPHWGDCHVAQDVHQGGGQAADLLHRHHLLRFAAFFPGTEGALRLQVDDCGHGVAASADGAAPRGHTACNLLGRGEERAV